VDGGSLLEEALFEAPLARLLWRSMENLCSSGHLVLLGDGVFITASKCHCFPTIF
jgi:hypothetical protein